MKKGQELLNLNKRVLEAQLAISKIQSESIATIAVATADLEVAKERFGKLNRLKSSGTAHSTEVARAEADLKKAEAQLSIANEEKMIAGFRVEEINGQIEQRILRSPIDGVVLEINREVSESATAPQEGQQNRPLVKVAQIDKLLLVISFFNPSAPFPPKARGRRGFGESKNVGRTFLSAAIGKTRSFHLFPKNGRQECLSNSVPTTHTNNSRIAVPRSVIGTGRSPS